MQRAKTLHVSVGTACNNNCLFCMEPRKFQDNGRLDIGRHKDFIRNSVGKGFTRIVLTRKEPTLSLDKVLPLASFARSLGYDDVMLVTNGRLLSNMKVVQRILDSGINHIEVSLHGSSSLIHESLTRTPGSFAQTIRGLENIRESKENRHLFFTVNFTITKLNCRDIPAFHALASSFRPDKIIFNFFMPLNEAAGRVGLLLPRYSDAMQEIRKIDGRDIRLIDFPLCITGGEAMGHIEDYHLIIAGDTDAYRRDNWRKAKGLARKCALCRHNESCVKPSTEYIRIYGEEEFSA